MSSKFLKNMNFIHVHDVFDIQVSDVHGSFPKYEHDKCTRVFSKHFAIVPSYLVCLICILLKRIVVCDDYDGIPTHCSL